MIRVIMADGQFFGISPDSYDLAVQALDYDAPSVVDLNLENGGSLIVRSDFITSVTRQTREQLEAAMEHEASMDRLRDEIYADVIPRWES